MKFDEILTHIFYFFCLLKFMFFEKAAVLTLLTKCQVGDFFQILWPSHNVLTLSLRDETKM